MEKAAINHINKKYNKCFKQPVTVVLNHGEKNHQQQQKLDHLKNKDNQK